MSATRSLQFADCFWGTEFTSFVGFDTLCIRLKQGKHTAQDLEEFLKARAKIEETYARDLTKLARQYHAKEEIGSLKATWEELKSETENVANVHMGTAKKILQEFEAVKDFKEKQRAERKKSEDTVKKAQSYKKNSFDKQIKSKRTYEKSCKDSDHAGEVYQKVLSLQKPKEMEASLKKSDAAKAHSEKCDSQYQDAVKSLDEARIMWEREMEICCNTFQDLETERISFLRGVMWRYSNLNSQLAVELDEHYEKLRQQLENCDPEGDNNLFIESKSTGKERPAAILYENFYTKSFSMPDKKPSGPSKISAPVSSFSSRELPEIPLTPPTDRKPPESTSSLGGVYSSVSDNRGDSLVSNASAGEYALVGSVVKSEPKSTKVRFVKAEYDYEAQGDQELTLRIGDVVEVVEMEDETWWKGRMKDGMAGMFPSTFVSLI